MSKLQWQGEDVTVRYGFCDVITSEKPLYWYNYHCRENGSARLAAIEVTTKDGKPFVIYNGHGIGWFKLSKGGWPNEGHSSFDGQEFVESSDHIITEYDQLMFRMEHGRQEAWFNEKYPEAIKQKEALLAMINRYK